MTSTSKDRCVPADPVAVVVAAVAAAEPGMTAATITEVVSAVAPAPPEQRRLARALDQKPALLTSTEPSGPRLVGDLVRALLARGAEHVRMPRCAHCGQPVALINRDGPRRICRPCHNRQARRGPCRTCGRELRSGDGRDGVCARCAARHDGADPVVELAERLGQKDPAADGDRLRAVIEAALPSASGQRTVAAELAAHPERLTGDAARGSVGFNRLLRGLLDDGVGGITAPPCPWCGRVVALTHGRDGLRCCRPCYTRTGSEPCVGCGLVRPVASRNPDGPRCARCHHADPIRHVACPGCGRGFRGTSRLCRRCAPSASRPAYSATCALCDRYRPCYFADTPAARCEPCSQALRVATCTRCDRDRPVRGRDPDGAPLCHDCGRRPKVCAGCERLTRVRAALPDGPRCETCYERHPASYAACTRCGAVRRLYHFGLCPGCVVRELVVETLSDQHGTIPEHVAPVVTALCRATSPSAVRWLERHGPGLLRRLRDDDRVVTHDVLDGYLPARGAHELRATLVAAGVLDDRDERLAALERWLAETTDSIADDHERQVLRRYTAWKVLPRLRTASARNQLTTHQVSGVRREFRTVLRLLDWLHTQDRSLGSATQTDLDRWALEHPGAHHARPFLAWVVARHHAPPVKIAARRSGARRGFVATDERWGLARRLLHDDTLDPRDRFAGLMLLLYAQPAARTVRLTTDTVTQRVSDHAVQLSLGREPLQLLPPVGELALHLLHERPGRRAALDVATDSGWLLPGTRPASPMNPGRLNARLADLGISPSACRNTTVLETAAELPAAIIAGLLGFSLTTACAWTVEAGPDTDYAAALLHRHPSTSTAGLEPLR